MSNDLVQQKSSYFVRKTPASSSSSTTNVQNKPAPVLNIPGTRTSIQNSQLLTSIGIPSIDSFLGNFIFLRMKNQISYNSIPLY